MPTFTCTIDIAAPPERVWSVLGDLASVDRWIPGVKAVEVDGLTRRCTFEDGHVQDEQISDYSPTRHSYRYRIDGAPLPVTDNEGTFVVQPAPGGSRVVWDSSFEPLDPAAADQIAAMWQPFLPMVLDNLKQVVEA